MKEEIYYFLNKNGQVARAIRWTTDDLCVVQLKSSARIEFLSSTEELDRDNVSYKLLARLKKYQVQSGAFQIHEVGTIRAANDQGAVTRDVALAQEDDKIFPHFVKYSFATHVSLILILFVVAWALQKYFPSEPVIEPVQIFTQVRPKTETIPVVAPSQHEIPRQQVRSVNPKPIKTTTPKLSKTSVAQKVAPRTNARHVVTRPGTNLGGMGALAVLGGMRSGRPGASGFNLKAKTSGPGIGYGGPAMRGGNPRGMLGRGLVTSGLGDGNGSLKGYGGYGTHGRGGGVPGYGEQDIGGGSGGGGAFYTPITEDDFSEGGLDVDQINAVIQRNMGQITYCYEKGLQARPGLSGRVEVKFIIGSSGNVGFAKIADSSIGSQFVEGCIVNKLRTWKFPRPVGNVSVRVSCPFSLKRLSQG